jgi:DNA polymerase III subunit delta'
VSFDALPFDGVTEQLEAKALLRAALAEGPAHAYLLHGPPGVGKRDLALLFAAELLGDHARVARRSHPDLYVLEPIGDQIRIDDIRELRRDLHMRPFEASRRVYLVFGADTMNEDAADALLKDLEEPPPYAVILLIANDIGPLPDTIRSRCQPVPFRRLSERAVREAIRARAPELADEEVTALSRVAGGRLDRAARLIDPAAAKRRESLLQVARAVYLDAEFDPAAGAEALLAGIAERGAEAKEKSEESVGLLEVSGREAEQRVRRAQRGAERDELLAVLEELEWWYRDLVVVAAGAEAAAVHVDRLAELRQDATRERLLAAEEACAIVRDAWRRAEELQLSAGLALEALLVRLRREFAGPALVRA